MKPNLKRLLSFFSSPAEKGPLIRVDGSLSGKARLDEKHLTQLQETVKTLSSKRPYTYDLEFSGGRFSLIILDSLVPKRSFGPDPEGSLGEDLQNILETLPPEDRPKIQCTFRILWQEGGEVIGVVYQVKPPGRIVTEKRIRPEEEYDRLAEEQAQEGYGPHPRKRLPLWAAIPLVILVLAGGFWVVLRFGPQSRFKALEAAISEAEMEGFEDLIGIRDPKAGYESIELTLYPLQGYSEKIKALRGSESIEGIDDPLKPLPPHENKKNKLAGMALIRGRLQLEIFDPSGLLVDSIPLDVSGFDGTGPVRVRAREARLSSTPARVAIRP